MAKLLYIALVNYEDPADGVGIKVHSQIAGMEALGYDVSCAAYGKDGAYVFSRESKELLGKTGNSPDRVSMMASLLQYLKGHKFDVCYIRFPYTDRYLKKIIKTLKKKGTTIYMEVATYPMRKLTVKRNGLVSAAFYQLHKFYSRDLGKYIEKVLYIGNKTETILGCKAELIPNGCDVQQYTLKKYDGAKDKELTMIAVAAMFGNHGYERIINGMADYYKAGNCDVKIKLYLVGDGPALQSYKDIVEDNKLEEYVIFCGRKSGEELEALFDCSDIALSSLGQYKSKLFQNSTLKVKEYLARGIPFVYAYDEIGLREDLPYALKLPNQPGTITMEEILAFYDNMKGKDYRQEMRAYAAESFSWKAIYEKTILQ